MELRRCQLLELLDHLFEFSTQHGGPCNLCIRRTAIVTVDVSVHFRNILAQSFLAGDRAAFLGGDDFRRIWSDEDAKSVSCLCKGLSAGTFAARWLASSLTSMIASTSPAHMTQHVRELHGKVELRLAIIHCVISSWVRNYVQLGRVGLVALCHLHGVGTRQYQRALRCLESH